MNNYPYVPGWRLNKENNKPAAKHSVLMLTRHGVAEGEWNGNEWIQYRWSCKVKDSDVLYWIHLENFTQLEKEGENIQQEQPDNEDIDKVAQELYEHLYELKRRNNVPTNLYDKQEIIDLWKAGVEYGRNHPKQEQPEVDYNIVPLPEEKMARYIAYCLGREDDDCNCPTCCKHVTGLRLFPYYYDRENNDVYFASVCPECGKIIISKE